MSFHKIYIMYLIPTTSLAKNLDEAVKITTIVVSFEEYKPDTVL